MIRWCRATSHNLPCPLVATRHSAGFDLPAAEQVILAPGSTKTIRTGWRVAIPPGWVGLVRGRSGLAFHHRIYCTEGTVDADYRGEVSVQLRNDGYTTMRIEAGDRIAQLVVSPCLTLSTEVDTLDDTDRGANGFGSTGCPSAA